MTVPVQAPPVGARPAGPYNARLVVHVSGDARKRLRLFAAVNDRPMGHVLDELLLRELPPTSELGRRLHQDGEPDDDQH
jgi:hypothetical protein